MLVTRLMSLLPCLFIIQWADLEKANVVLNIIQFVQLPFVIIPAMRFISAPCYVDDEAYKGRFFLAVKAVSVFLILMNLYQVADNMPESGFGRFAVSGLLLLYVYFLIYITRVKLQQNIRIVKDGKQLQIRNESFAC